MFEKSGTRTAIALTVAAGAAVAAPSAGARPADLQPPPAVAATHATAPAPHTATRIVEVRSSGFDWGDAGLGAAAMLSVLGVGAGAVVVTRRSRPRVT
jgi:hypothetical protein